MDRRAIRSSPNDAVRRGNYNSRSKAVGAEGSRWLAVRDSGTVLHGRRGDAVVGAQHAAQPGRQNARRAGGALERGCAAFQPVNATLTAFFSKKLNRSAQSGE
jgi:hypothetical protein